jgi:DNA (cytosine-5)-methyltransferase 1
MVTMNLGLTGYDEFAGFGGTSQGMHAAGIDLKIAANHAPIALEVHAKNFPNVDHYLGDVTKADLTIFPRVDIFGCSPSCPPWSNARGVRRDFDNSTQGALLGVDGTVAGAQGPDEDTSKRRALMEEVPRYLRACALRGEPVLGGLVENVVECRKWDQFGRWRREIENIGPGYATKVIALNSMHARPRRTRRAPQSRDRLYVMFWLRKLGRTPDFDKWLRPRAYCSTCDQIVTALQVFKKPGADMGRYGRHGQYFYRCPNVRCRNQVVQPEVLPAIAALDLSLPPGAKIGERVDAKGRPDPLEPATMARIANALVKLSGQGLLVPAGGTWRDAATSIHTPMPTRTTRESDALALPPMLVPLTARDKPAHPASEPLKTQTTRHETAVVIPPFIASLRGGGSKTSARTLDQPLHTFSAGGTHHALIGPPSEAFLLPYNTKSRGRSVSEPVGTLTTRDRYGIVGTGDIPDVNDCTFRMMALPEIANAMAFAPDYKVKGTKRQIVQGYGNAVTPPTAEVLYCCLIECILGYDPYAPAEPAGTLTKVAA